MGSKSKQEHRIWEELYNKSWNSSSTKDGIIERKYYICLNASQIDTYKPSVDTDYIQKRKETRGIKQHKSKKHKT